MKNIDFEKALQFILKWEGFISNHPNDPGGFTIWGISSRSYPANVARMKKRIDEGKKDEAFAEAKKIYYENYWLKAKCHEHAFPLNLIMFDTAVNCGRGRANKLLEDCNGWEDYLLNRIAFYSKLKTAKYFIRGLVNRVISLYEFVKG